MAVLAQSASPREVLQIVGNRAADLIASIDDMYRPVPGHDWTVGQVATHMIVTTRGNAESMSGTVAELAQFVPDVDRYSDRVAGMNTKSIAAEPARDALAASEALRAAVTALTTVSEQKADDGAVPTPWYGRGDSLTVEIDVRLIIGHLLNHALDIASGLGRRWPLSRDEVLTAIPSIHVMMLRTFDAESARQVDATFRVRIRGGDTIGIRIRNAAIEVAPWGTWNGRPDCTVSADPVAYFLLAFGRTSQWPLIASGRLLSYGRKPWKALSLRGLFVNP